MKNKRQLLLTVFYGLITGLSLVWFNLYATGVMVAMFLVVPTTIERYDRGLTFAFAIMGGVTIGLILVGENVLWMAWVITVMGGLSLAYRMVDKAASINRTRERGGK